MSSELFTDFEAAEPLEAAAVVELAPSASVVASAYNGRSSGEAITYYVSADGRHYRLSENFELHEMQCNDGTNRVVVHPALIEALERIRAHFGGRAVAIGSGFRTDRYNAVIGGAPGSLHTLGMAADIRVAGVPVERVAAFAWHGLAMGGVSMYTEESVFNPFTHVDVGRRRTWGEGVPDAYDAGWSPPPSPFDLPGLTGGAGPANVLAAAGAAAFGAYLITRALRDG